MSGEMDKKVAAIDYLLGIAALRSIYGCFVKDTDNVCESWVATKKGRHTFGWPSNQQQDFCRRPP